MKKDAEREYAQLLYVKNQGITLKEIAEKVGVHPNTITNWKNQDNWEGTAEVLLVTRHEQLRRLYNQLKQLNDTILNREQGKQYPTKSEADTMTQITRSIGRLEKDISVGVIIDVFVPFIEWRSKQDPARAKQIVDLQDKWIKTVLS